MNKSLAVLLLMVYVQQKSTLSHLPLVKAKHGAGNLTKTTHGPLASQDSSCSTICNAPDQAKATPACTYDIQPSSTTSTDTTCFCSGNTQFCSVNPCIHGTCGIMSDNSGFVCASDAGQSGYLCNQLAKPCATNICLNGGICTKIQGQDVCTCPSGWTGSLCDQDVNECALQTISTQLCFNGGDCLNTIGSYVCACPVGWEGPSCQTQQDSCALYSGYCQHSTGCTNVPGSGFYCICTPGWFGMFCNLDINECDASPCQNGGVCANTPGSYQCICVGSWSGNNCEIPTPCLKYFVAIS